jgi:hypothetical protein
MNFWQLWKKEMNGSLWSSTFFMAIFLLFIEQGRHDGFVWFPPGVAKWDSPFGIPMGLFFWLGLWGIAMAFYCLHYEWTGKSIYLLKSLPLKGYEVLGAQIVGILSGVLTLIPIVAGAYLFNWHEKLSRFKIPVQTAWYFGLTVVLILLSVIFFLVTITQFAFLMGKLVNKYQFVISGMVFCFSIKFLYELLIKSKSLLTEWIPTLVIRFGTACFDTCCWFFLSLYLIGALFFFINNWLYEQKVEL